MDARLLWLALGAFAGSVESTVVVGFLPAIATETGASVAQAGLLVFGYSIAYGIGTPLLSTLFGKLDRRSVVVLAEFVFGCAALMIGLLPGFLALVLARTSLALGAGLFATTAQSTAVALSAPGQRGRAISTVVMGGSLAVAFGAPIGALVGQAFGWRVTYIAIGLLAISVAATMYSRLPGTIPGDVRSLRERLSVVTLPGVPITLAASFFGTLSMFLLLTYLAPVSTDLMRLDPKMIPALMLAFGIGAICGNVLGGRMSDRVGPRKTLLVVSSLTTALLLVLPVLPSVAGPALMPAYFCYVALFGCVTWAFFPPQLLRLAALAPQSMILTASLNLTAMNIGGAAAALIGGYVFEHFGPASVGPCGGAVGLIALGVIYIAPDRRDVAAPVT